MTISELEVHGVITRFGRVVRNIQRTIGIIFAFNFSFARSFDGERQTSKTGLALIEAKSVVRVRLARNQRRSANPHILGITDVAVIYFDFEWRALDVVAHFLNRHIVVTSLTRSERNSFQR